MLNFDKIYDDFYTVVLNYMKSRMSKDIQKAEELTQDIFMKIHLKLDKYNSEDGKISTWIFTIANNTLIDYYRKRKLETVSIFNSLQKSGSIEFDGDGLLRTDVMSKVSNIETPEDVMLRSEAKQKMVNVLLSMPKRYRRHFNLHYNHQMKYEDIAARVNEPINTVKSKMKSAKEYFTLNYK